MRRTITRVGLGSLALLIAWGVVMEVAAAAFRTNLDGIRPNWTTMQTRRCRVHDTWMRPRLAYDYRTPTPTAGLGPSFSQFAPRGRFDQLWDDYHTAETTQFPNAFPGYEWAAHWAFQWFCDRCDVTRDAWLNTHAAPISITLRELWYEPARQEIVVMADVNRRPRESWSAAPFDVLRSSYRLADFNTAEISRAAERLAAQTGPRDIAVSTRGLSSEGGASQLKALLGAFVFTEAGARRFGEGSTLSIDGGPPITSPAGLAAERTSD